MKNFASILHQKLHTFLYNVNMHTMKDHKSSGLFNLRTDVGAANRKGVALHPSLLLRIELLPLPRDVIGDERVRPALHHEVAPLVARRRTHLRSRHRYINLT